MEMNSRALKALTGAMLSVAMLTTAAPGPALAQPVVPRNSTAEPARPRATAVGVWKSSAGPGANGVDSLELRADGTFELKFAYYCPPGAMCFVGPRAPDRGTWLQSGAAVRLTGGAGTYSGRVQGDELELNGDVLHRIDGRLADRPANRR
ncbi:hypothetical protein ACWGNF_26050 [Streptomyces sp. NPDC055808]